MHTKDLDCFDNVHFVVLPTEAAQPIREALLRISHFSASMHDAPKGTQNSRLFPCERNTGIPHKPPNWEAFSSVERKNIYEARMKTVDCVIYHKP